MNIAIALILVLATVALVAYLVAFIRNDGYGQRAASGLPRSHDADVFERGAHAA